MIALNSSKSILRNTLDFFVPKRGDVPCLGIALGRDSLWAVFTTLAGNSTRVEWCEKIPLNVNLFSKEPSLETAEILNSALGDIGKKIRGSALELQVALPDPFVSFEVFDLDKMPASGNPRKEFLAWRFNQAREPSAPQLSLASQFLGEENGKALLLALAVEKRLLDLLDGAFRHSGLKVSVIDTGLSYCFNFFHDSFQEKGQTGAMVVFEADYWGMVLWDKETRPRFARSKWFEKAGVPPKGPALEKVFLEIERTIRSYVYSEKNQSVENLFVLAQEECFGLLLKNLNERTAGSCVGLHLEGKVLKKAGVLLDKASPSAIAAAVHR